MAPLAGEPPSSSSDQNRAPSGAGTRHQEEDPGDDTRSDGLEQDNVADESEEENFDESREFCALNSTMEELNAFMDAMEQKNQSIQDQLKSLLEESRQARLLMHREQDREDDDDDDGDGLASAGT